MKTEDQKIENEIEATIASDKELTIKQIFDYVLVFSVNNPDGFSLDKNLNSITKGYISASAITQNSFGDDGLKNCIAILFGQDVEEFDGIGGWFNPLDGKYYFDVIRVFDTLEECVEYGNDNGQISVFDANTGLVIRL